MIPGRPDPEELHLLKAEASKKIEIEPKLKSESAEKLFALKEELGKKFIDIVLKNICITRFINLNSAQF
ncbi:MAG: hypothetical protein F3745_06470 [Nitrospinae bacterium]|nr:hypothetical protein [Nitrospinota bacterium]